jgi:hypothetical protein
MALVRVFSPQTESEVAVIAALLEAHEIPVFVHNRNFGSLLPGLQINAYNSQSIMVPEERVADAVELLAEFRAQAPKPPTQPLPVLDKIRVVLEAFLFGWFVPGRTKSSESEEKERPDVGNSPERTRENQSAKPEPP